MSIFGSDLPPGNLDESAPHVPDNDYARNKIDASSAAIAADVNFKVSVLHPTCVYSFNSKRLEFYREILKIGFIVFDAGKNGINNIIHADDVAASIVGALTRTNGRRSEEYCINGEGIKYSEWFRILESQSGVSEYLRVPPICSFLCRGPLRGILLALRLRPPIIVPAYKRKLYERQTFIMYNKATDHFGWHPYYQFKYVIAHEDAGGV